MDGWMDARGGLVVMGPATLIRTPRPTNTHHPYLALPCLALPCLSSPCTAMARTATAPSSFCMYARTCARRSGVCVCVWVGRSVGCAAGGEGGKARERGERGEGPRGGAGAHP
eukprot:scaffold2827_cov409-Prasinococcus_capsulatus_cf.AAC.8